YSGLWCGVSPSNLWVHGLGKREISAIVYASIEIAETAVSISSWRALAFSQFNLVGYLSLVSWLAFVVFAFVAFEQLSFKWLRVIAAFLVLIFLPIVVGVIYLAAYSFKIIPPIPIEWLLLAAPAGAVVGLSLRLGIVGFIYVWSDRRERAATTMVSADPAT
ncbi:hypothetical protein, partial [Bradyrhizobium sp.]|uniref:hypothetical protein n=1 Tax=Bradyrhizobium sp. TaxID=376 RepID=UPI003D0CC5AD